MKGVLILSHEMSKFGELNGVSKSRAELAAKLCEKSDYDFVITSGWDYRPDCNQAIADVMASFLLDRLSICDKKIFISRQSRDTVGDAVFARLLFASRLQSLTVVTSDFHLQRVILIFEKIFGSRCELKFFGADTHVEFSDEQEIMEAASIDAFNATFKGVDATNDYDIYNTLRSAHPYYNGDIFSKIITYEEFAKSIEN